MQPEILQQKKKRFSKDKIFFQDYKKLWLLINGYIKICDVPPLEKTSYISYHDMNDRNKPEKKYLLYMSAVQNLREDLYIKSFFQDQI